MKLVAKLALALVLGMCLVLGAYGYLRVRRERALFTADMQRDARMLGRAVGKSVSELLDFSRRRASHKSPTDLVSLSRRTLELRQPLAQKRGLTLKVASAADSLCAEVDPGQIQQGLTNLVVNAIQAINHPGEIEAAIARSEVRPPHEVDAAPGE